MSHAVLAAMGIALTTLAAGPEPEHRVLVLPFEFMSLSPSPELEDAIVVTLTSRFKHVLNAEKVRQDQGINLKEHTERCSKDVLCLVQLGELLGATKLVMGQVRRDGTPTDKLRVSVVDIARAALQDTLLWEVPSNWANTGDAVATAVRQLLFPHDATIDFDLSPKDVVISFYGREIKPLKGKEPMPYWSGVYWVKATRPGYDPKALKVVVASNSTSRVTIHLESDPLWVQPRKSHRAALRNLSTSVAPATAKNYAYKKWWVWSIVGAGIIGASAGGYMMNTAQTNYNDAASQSRDFGSGLAASVETTTRNRDQWRSDFDKGSYVFIGGSAVVGTTLLWVLLDSMVGSSNP